MSNIGIKSRYDLEITEINRLLSDLKKGHIYELTNVKSDGYLSTNIDKLICRFDSLITKIDNGRESDSEKLSKAFTKTNLEKK